MLVKQKKRGYNYIGDIMKYSIEDLKNIEKYEEKRGIKYKKSNGRFYKITLLIACISYLWLMIMQLFYIFGRVLNIIEGNEKIDNIFITVTVSFIVMVVAVILYAFRLKLTAFAVDLAGIIASALSFIKITGVNDSFSMAGSTISEYDEGIFGLKRMFYWRHGIPMAVVVICLILLSFIIIRERTTLKKEYDIITKNNYQPQILKDNE